MKNKRISRKIGAVLLTVVAFIVFTLSVSAAEVLSGDLNQDGYVNTTDVVLLRRAIASGYNVTVNENEADLNADGYVNTTDVVLLRRYIAGGYDVELKPNIPTPSCSHSAVIDVAVEPTCTMTGLTEGKHCGKCGEILRAQQTIPAKGHTEESYGATAPTCTQPGFASGVKCSVCGVVLQASNPIPALGHKEEILPGKAATCTQNGLTEGKKCFVCSEILIAQKTISAKGHTAEIVPGKAATCTSSGMSEGKKCVTCGKILVAQSFLPAKGHSSVNGVCTVCGNGGEISDEYFVFTLQDDGTYSIKAKDVNNLPAEVVIPATYQGSAVTNIGYEAFASCENLEAITIPNSIVNISNAAFANCTNLTSIELPDSVEHIGSGAYLNCRSLLSISISCNVSNIGWNAFGGCTAMVAFNVDSRNEYFCSVEGDLYNKDVTVLINYACGKDASFFTIPDSVTYISDYAFYYGKNLAAITIPDSVTDIGVCAFENCYRLTSITIPKGVTNIGDGMFAFCGSLTNIDIPNSVTSIGDQAFLECYALTSITIPDCVTSIGNGAFRHCSGLTSIIIPSSVTRIANQMFYHCSSLTDIIIPDSVTSIGDSAFNGCSSLTSVTIPDDVTSIGEGAFRGCSNLTSIAIPNGVESVSVGVFRNCIGLTSITIPDSVTSIGNSAFYGCSSLTSITISNSVKNIDNWSISGCINLNSINFTGTVVQWNDISKENNYWDYDTPFYTIYCTDGALTKSGESIDDMSKTFTVTFKDHDGTVLQTQSGIKAGEPAMAPTTPTREGYSFVGWDKAFDRVTSDMVIMPVYVPMGTTDECEHTVYKDWWCDTFYVENTIKTNSIHEYYHIYNRICECGANLGQVQGETLTAEHTYNENGLCGCGAYRIAEYEPWEGVNVSGAIANVYSTPNATTRYGYINVDEVVTVLGQYGEKYLIEYKLDSGNGVKQGYVFAQNIGIEPSEETPETPEMPEIPEIPSNTKSFLDQYTVDKQVPSDTSNTEAIGYAPAGGDILDWYRDWGDLTEVTEEMLGPVIEYLLESSVVNIDFPSELVIINEGISSNGEKWTKYHFTFNYDFMKKTIYLLHVYTADDVEGQIYVMFAKAGGTGLEGKHDEVYRKATINKSMTGKNYLRVSSGSMASIAINAKFSEVGKSTLSWEGDSSNFLYWDASQNNIVSAEEWRESIHFEERFDANEDENLPQSAAEAVKAGFEKLPSNDSKYHQLDKSKAEFEKGSCLKYIHSDGREAIYEVILDDQNQKKVESDTQATRLLTLAEYPSIGPTFNYSPNDYSYNWIGQYLVKMTPNSIAHYYLDMLPYYWWGNVPS